MGINMLMLDRGYEIFTKKSDSIDLMDSLGFCLKYGANSGYLWQISS